MHRAAETIQPAQALEAASAFARLYRRWFDDARGLFEDNRHQARLITGSPVVDILAVWDEGAGCWLADTPTVIRLAERDAAIFTMKGPHIALFFGSVDTRSPIAFGSAGACGRDGDGSRSLRWKSFRPCSYAIGSRVTELAFNEDSSGLPTSVEVLLDDGGAFEPQHRRAYPSYASTMPIRYLRYSSARTFGFSMRTRSPNWASQPKKTGLFMTTAWTRAEVGPTTLDRTSSPNRSSTELIASSSTMNVAATGSPRYMPKARLSSCWTSKVAIRSFRHAGSSSTAIPSMRSTR